MMNESIMKQIINGTNVFAFSKRGLYMLSIRTAQRQTASNHLERVAVEQLQTHSIQTTSNANHSNNIIELNLAVVKIKHTIKRGKNNKENK